MNWPDDLINTVVVGDCVELMKSIPDNSIAACVTDPPYELGFMGKAWDNTGIAYNVDMWRQVLRILKPGGHLVSFGGTRTYHRMACAIEDAGFEVRDQLQWLYGSGFPKSLDVSKAIDKAAGAERIKIGDAKNWGASKASDGKTGYGDYSGKWDITEPETKAAKQWHGWGTALKPANEPICLARKPLSENTVAANVLKWGTGAININASRIGNEIAGWGGGAAGGNTWNEGNCGLSKEGKARPVEGRWPANVILDEESGEFLDGQSGKLTSGANPVRRGSDKFRDVFGDFKGQTECEAARGIDTGGPSRFFYCAKTSREERNIGLDGLEKRPLNWSSGDKNPGSFQAEGTDRIAQNFHPTVKPVDLMKWLVQLVTPPNGTVIDPFAGSGSTLLACADLNFPCCAIELNPEYAEIARKRVADELAQGKLF